MFFLNGRLADDKERLIIWLLYTFSPAEEWNGLMRVGRRIRTIKKKNYTAKERYDQPKGILLDTVAP